MPMIKLIVALGNPGKEYEGTRHNIGQMALAHFANSHNLSWKKHSNGFYTVLKSKQDVYLLMPQTYMNLSGECLTPFCHYFRIPLSDCLVLHDDLDLDFCKVVIKKGGGHGGHNGLRSIIDCMKDANFYRLRMGISRPEYSGQVSSYVLSPFDQNEEKQLPSFFDEIQNCLEVGIRQGIDKASQKYSRKILI